MLYMVGKIFLSVDIVYNELVHEKNNNNNFPTEFRNKYKSFFKSEMEVCELALCHHTHIYPSNWSLQIIQIIS